MLNIETTIERIREIIDCENFSQLQEELNNFHSADLAEILIELNIEERIVAFDSVDEDKAAELLEYLTPQYQVAVRKMCRDIFCCERLPRILLPKSLRMTFTSFSENFFLPTIFIFL